MKEKRTIGLIKSMIAYSQRNIVSFEQVILVSAIIIRAAVAGQTATASIDNSSQKLYNSFGQLYVCLNKFYSFLFSSFPHINIRLLISAWIVDFSLSARSDTQVPTFCRRFRIAERVATRIGMLEQSQDGGRYSHCTMYQATIDNRAR